MITIKLVLTSLYTDNHVVFFFSDRVQTRLSYRENLSRQSLAVCECRSCCCRCYSYAISHVCVLLVQTENWLKAFVATCLYYSCCNYYQEMNEVYKLWHRPRRSNQPTNIVHLYLNKEKSRNIAFFITIWNESILRGCKIPRYFYAIQCKTSVYTSMDRKII